MKITLRHKDKKFVRDVAKYFKLQQRSIRIPNDEIGLKIKDLVDLSKRIPNNVNHFSGVGKSGNSIYVVAYMGCTVIFDEAKNTITLKGSKQILFRVPKISVYLKPALLTKDYMDVVSAEGIKDNEPWFKIDVIENDNKFISSQYPQCKAAITIFQAKRPEPEPEIIEVEKDDFEGPEFVKHWLDHMSDGGYVNYAPVSADDDFDDNNTPSKDDELEYFVKCNRCGYSNQNNTVI